MIGVIDLFRILQIMLLINDNVPIPVVVFPSLGGDGDGDVL